MLTSYVSGDILNFFMYIPIILYFINTEFHVCKLISAIQSLSRKMKECDMIKKIHTQF